MRCKRCGMPRRADDPLFAHIACDETDELAPTWGDDPNPPKPVKSYISAWDRQYGPEAVAKRTEEALAARKNPLDKPELRVIEDLLDMALWRCREAEGSEALRYQIQIALNSVKGLK